MPVADDDYRKRLAKAKLTGRGSNPVLEAFESGLGGAGTVAKKTAGSLLGKVIREAKAQGRAKASTNRVKVPTQRQPRPGEVVPYNPPPRYGPNTKSEQYVDDLFGV